MAVVASALSPHLSRRRVVRKPSVRSRRGIVVSQNRQASEIGARVLEAGGHAVDAVIATAFALGVVEPWMSGIGGVGAAVVHDAATGQTRAFDFGGRSPAGLDPANYALAGGADSDLFGWPMVTGNRNTVGATAVVAPTQPAGLGLLHRTFGRKTWRSLVEPAIAIADEGPVVDWHTTLIVATAFADLARDAGAKARFLPGGAPPVSPGTTAAKPNLRLPMKELAKTLALIAEEGADALYRGALARSIAGDIRAMGGCLTEDDLANVAPREVTPLKIAYRDRTIHVLPELNGGPTLAVAFRDLVRRRPEPESGPEARTFVAYAAAMREAWKHRFAVMGDAGERTAPTSTTHLAVVDRDGNVVTLTQTLLSLFGSRIVLPGSGILMNNGINWFDPRPGGPNAIAPNRRVLANYVPSVMTGGGEAIGIGGCGGRRILPAVFQILAMNADFGFDLDTTFHTPRVDVSGVARVASDRRMPQATRDALAAAYEVIEAEPVPHSNPYTIASAVRRKGGTNEAATEPEHPWAEAVAEGEAG